MMMPPKFYTRNDLEALSSEVPPRDVVKKFLSPGMTFEDVAPAHPYRSQTMTPNLTKDNQNEEDRQEAIKRANIYNAFADYQSPYGISFRVMTYHAVNPWDNVSIPRVLEKAFVKLCSATTDYRAKHEIIPVLGREFVRGSQKYHGVYRSSGPCYTWTVSLAGLKEIGLDLESLAATMGDALAMVFYKCGMAYFGPFFFRPMPIDSNEHPGSSTISLCISWVDFEIMDTIFPHPLVTKTMLRYWGPNVPSPNESPYLWNVFKMAFISRGNRYCSIIVGITPEDMIRRFETLYDEVTDAGQHPWATF